ncbi:MAG: hypothetical protein A3G23_02115 [Bacteroidetes bacterium RIFCSPLOWO2_12_FULL_37_12]|nr:MAG: hypothetical protein A3G23_02115 [Bacteroidetes bacterium RIFCSPLOWO2_12_FULL_37_12]
MSLSDTDSSRKKSWDFSSSRLGVSTIGLTNRFLTYYPYKNNDFTFFSVDNDWLYNENLPENSFVKRDMNLNVFHYNRIHENFHYIPQISLNEYYGSKTSIRGFINNFSIATPSRVFINDFQLGYQQDTRDTLQDKGLVYGSNLLMKIRNDSTFKTGIRGNILQTQIYPRSNNKYYIEGYLNQLLNPQADYSLSLGYKSRRVEDYLNNNIQSIVSDTMITGLGFHYEMLKGLTFSSQNSFELPKRNFNYRRFNDSLLNKQNSRFEESRLNTKQSLSFSRNTLNILFTFSDVTRSRDYELENSLFNSTEAFTKELEAEKIKNIDEEVKEWRILTNYGINAKHSIQLNSVGQLLRIDTPSEKENQDRDEVYYQTELGFVSQWNPIFKTNISLAGNYREHRFIKSENSNINFVQQGLLLTPGFQWNPGNFYWSGFYGLNVSYLVKNLLFEQEKNRSNRQFLSSQNFKYLWNENHSSELLFVHTENFLSRLNWEKFSESPLDSTFSDEIQLNHFLSLGKKISRGNLKTGYRVFYQSKTMTGTLQKLNGLPVMIYAESMVLQQGPDIGFLFTKKRFSFSVSCWFQFAKNYIRYKEGIAPGSGHLYTEEELNAVIRNFYPYFSVSSKWNL